MFELDCFQQYIILAFINYLWDNLFHVQHLANMLDLLSRCHSIIQNPLKGLMHFQISKHVHPGSKYPNAFGISKTKIANQIEKASRKFLWIFRPSQTFRDKLGNFEEHTNNPPNFIFKAFSNVLNSTKCSNKSSVWVSIFQTFWKAFLLHLTTSLSAMHMKMRLTLSGTR